MHNGTASPSGSPDQTVNLPNPEAKPPAEILNLRWLAEECRHAGLLCALRLSRQLLSEPQVHLRDLESAFTEWQAARALPPPVATQRFAAIGLKGEVLSALQNFGSEALADSDPRRRAQLVRNYGLLLRATVYAYRFHGTLFGLSHKLTADPTPRALRPRSSAVLDARKRTYGVAGKTYCGPMITDAMMAALSQMQICVRLQPDDVALMQELVAAIEQGIPSFVGTKEQAWLIAGAEPERESYVFFDPISGTSRAVSLDEFSRLSSRIDVLVVTTEDFDTFDQI